MDSMSRYKQRSPNIAKLIYIFKYFDGANAIAPEKNLDILQWQFGSDNGLESYVPGSIYGGFDNKRSILTEIPYKPELMK